MPVPRMQVGVPSVTKNARKLQIASDTYTADPGFREKGRIEAGSNGRCRQISWTAGSSGSVLTSTTRLPRKRILFCSSEVTESSSSCKGRIIPSSRNPLLTSFAPPRVPIPAKPSASNATEPKLVVALVRDIMAPPFVQQAIAAPIVYVDCACMNEFGPEIRKPKWRKSLFGSATPMLLGLPESGSMTVKVV